jgi:predicted amidohydrolase YtcJ
MYADKILTNGQIVTVDNEVLHKMRGLQYRVKKMTAQFPIYERGALAIRGTEIVGVGTAADILNLFKGPNTQVINLKGRVVIPGLMDSHCHSECLGNDLKYGMDLTLAMSSEEIVTMVDRFIREKNLGCGQWALGSRWDEYKYARMANRWDLDKITRGGQLVQLTRVYRGEVFNTAVFKEILGIDDEDPGTWPKWWVNDPTPEQVAADPESYSHIDSWTRADIIYREERFIKALNKKLRVPNGVFIGGRGAPALVTNHPKYRVMAGRPAVGKPDNYRKPFYFSMEEEILGIKRTVEEYLRLGVTALRSARSDYGKNTKCWQEAHTRGYLKARLMGIAHGTYYELHRHPTEFISKDLDRMDVVRNLDGRYLRWREAKYYSDGGVSTRTAWMSEPYIDGEEQGETKPNYGIPVCDDYQARRQTYQASLERGMDLSTHSCGDQSHRFTVDLYLDLMDAIRKGEFPVWEGRLKATGGKWDFRWGLDHAYAPIEAKTWVIDDLHKHNIIAYVQPNFGWQLGASFVANLGPERMARLIPMRSYFEHGVICPNGSDYGVASHNPWHGLYFMLTREIQARKPKSFGTGKDGFKDETVGICEALISACAMGPYSTFAEDWKGSIKPGHVADLVILDMEDIFDLEKDPKLLLAMEDRVLATLIDGEVRYARPGSEWQPSGI